MRTVLDLEVSCGGGGSSDGGSSSSSRYQFHGFVMFFC